MMLTLSSRLDHYTSVAGNLKSNATQGQVLKKVYV